jgi:hypothetical protein
VDRLHLNSLGHTRMAATIAGALGLPPVVGDPGVGEGSELPPPPVLTRREALTRDVTWLGEYFAPWLWRHVRGRSSGDGLLAKRPELTALTWQSEDASS